jgi:hypothetical protein
MSGLQRDLSCQRIVLRWHTVIQDICADQVFPASFPRCLAAGGASLLMAHVEQCAAMRKTESCVDMGLGEMWLQEDERWID